MLRVFVIDKNKNPLMPCHPARARKLIDLAKARVYRLKPFTIILTEREEWMNIYCYTFKEKAPSKQVTVLKHSTVIIAAETETEAWKHFERKYLSKESYWDIDKRTISYGPYETPMAVSYNEPDGVASFVVEGVLEFQNTLEDT